MSERKPTENATKDPFPHEDVVWGVAYTIDPEFEDEVREYLGALAPFPQLLSTHTRSEIDHREKV